MDLTNFINVYMLFLSLLFFSIRVFFHGHWRLTGQQGKGGNNDFLFHFTTSTRSRTFRRLFATLHVRWLSLIFNRTACVYQIATQWDLPPYRITILLIDDMILICLFTWWFDSRFLLQQYVRGKRWTQSCMDYHPSIASKSTNQLSYSSHSFTLIQ